MSVTYHNPNEVLMGATLSNHKETLDMAGQVEAGIAVRLKSDGTLSTVKDDGELIGVSIGGSLSINKRCVIARKGLLVPVKLTAAFTPVIGDPVHIDDVTGLAVAAGVGATAVNAVYRSAKLVGKGEDKLDKDVALIDFPGGL